jgi:hypothetical protein
MTQVLRRAPRSGVTGGAASRSFDRAVERRARRAAFIELEARRSAALLTPERPRP